MENYKNEKYGNHLCKLTNNKRYLELHHEVNETNTTKVNYKQRKKNKKLARPLGRVELSS